MTTKTRPAASPPSDGQPAENAARNNLTLVCDVPINAIHPSPLNPRQQFDEQALQELADSIAADGLLEPIVVRNRPDAAVSPVDGLPLSFEIVAGERRWRAAKMAGQHTIPARILEGVDDKTALRLALLENLQRQDLDPIEEAEGYRALARELGLKQAEIASAVKRSQPAVAKSMSLLDLPDDVVSAIREGRLSVAHGVALAKFKKFPAACSRIAAKAIEFRRPSHDLERTVPGAYDLEREGVLKVMHTYSAPFDLAGTCEHCPHGAYRPMSDGDHICLRPAHYAELVEAARAQKQATLTAAQTDSAALPRVADLTYEQYRRISARSPSDCTAECPCRAQAEGFGGDPEPICTDPQRYDGLHRADDARQKQAAAQAYDAAVSDLEQRLDALTAGCLFDEGEGLEASDRRAVALVVQLALSRLMVDGIKETLAARAPQLKAGRLTAYDFEPTVGEQLAALPVREQLALAVDAILRSDLRQRRDWSSHHPARFAWFMQAPADAAAEPAAGCGERVPCDACGTEVAGHDVRDLGQGPLCPECASDVDPGDFAAKLGAPATVRCLDCGTHVAVVEAIGEPRGPLCLACAAADAGRSLARRHADACTDVGETINCAGCGTLMANLEGDGVADVRAALAALSPAGPLCPACAAGQAPACAVAEPDNGALCAVCGHPMAAEDLDAAALADEVLLCPACAQATPAEAAR